MIVAVPPRPFRPPRRVCFPVPLATASCCEQRSDCRRGLVCSLFVLYIFRRRFEEDVRQKTRWKGASRAPARQATRVIQNQARPRARFSRCGRRRCRQGSFGVALPISGAFPPRVQRKRSRSSAKTKGFRQRRIAQTPICCGSLTKQTVPVIRRLSAALAGCDWLPGAIPTEAD